MYGFGKISKFGLLVASVFALSVAWGTLGSQTADADGHHHHGERHEAMKSVGASMKKLGGAIAAGDAAAAEEAAKVISAVAANIPELFEVNSIPEKSRAKPEIWENFADFTAKGAAMGAAADKIAADAAAGNLGSDPRAVMRDVGATCGACHRVYRGPET